MKYSTKRQRRVVEAEDENTLDSLGLNINAIALGNEERDRDRGTAKLEWRSPWDSQ